MKEIAKKREEEIKISKLTKAEARDVLLKDIEQEYKDDLLQKFANTKLPLKRRQR